MEGLSDSMRRELHRLGVKVVVIEPGAVKTAMVERGVATAERLRDAMASGQRGRYGDLIEAMSNMARSFDTDGVSAERAAIVIANAATASRPRTRYTIGRDAAVLARLSRLVSDRFLDRAVRRILRPHFAGGRVKPLPGVIGLNVRGRRASAGSAASARRRVPARRRAG